MTKEKQVLIDLPLLEKIQEQLAALRSLTDGDPEPSELEAKVMEAVNSETVFSDDESKMRSILLVNAIRGLGDIQRMGLTLDLMERLDEQYRSQILAKFKPSQLTRDEIVKIAEERYPANDGMSDTQYYEQLEKQDGFINGFEKAQTLLQTK